jgi:hypothetical protein
LRESDDVVGHVRYFDYIVHVAAFGSRRRALELHGQAAEDQKRKL